MTVEISKDFKSTQEIPVPKGLIEQIIGQDTAVELIRKAAVQKRNVLLVGLPGTGKSMLAQAMAEILPFNKLNDILIYPNSSDANNPKVKVVNAGEAKKIIHRMRLDAKAAEDNARLIGLLLPFAWFILNYIMWSLKWISDVIYAATLLLGGFLIIGVALGSQIKPRETRQTPKLLIDNAGKKIAPFADGTGSRAGSLLGDVRHDPLQCFFDNSQIYKLEGNLFVETKIGDEINNLLASDPQNIIEERGCKAIFVPKNKFVVLGFKENKIQPVNVLSVNKNISENFIEIITENDNSLKVTPEHKVLVERENGKVFVEAQNLLLSDQLVCKTDVILDENDILKTYSSALQEQSKLYLEYLKVKEQNNLWGYNRIAKFMKQKIGKTRWWHSGAKPVPIKNIEWLKEKGLLPLKIDNPNLPIIAKVLGATFGDGGIFGNLNGIFLSSSEKEAVQEFKQDLIKIFGLEVSKNSHLIEGGVYGHSWCMRNANRNIVRFFLALNAPIGNKTSKELKIPYWISLNKYFEDEFYGSFIGSEMGIPKVHKQRNRLDMLSIGVGAHVSLEENRKEFLKQVNNYFLSKGINSTSIVKSNSMKSKDSFMYRLLLSTKLENVIKFNSEMKLNYCKYKKEKLEKTIENFMELKKAKYIELIGKGFGAETVMKLLNLTPKGLYQVLNI